MTASPLTMPVSPVPTSAARSTAVPADAESQAAEATGLPDAHRVLGDEALSGLLNRPVTITHVRVKPGRSLLLGHVNHGDAGQNQDHMGRHIEGQHGWTLLTLDPDKAQKAQERARSLGEELEVHCLRRRPRTHVLTGSVWTDPHLSKDLRDARYAWGEELDWQMLRYNPRRRVVAHVEAGNRPKIVRIDPQGVDSLIRTADRWREAGLPVTTLHALGTRGTAVWAPKWGAGDLEQHPLPEAARYTGEVIARLHQMSPEASAVVRLPEDTGQLAQHTSQVLPWLSQSAQRVATELSSRLSRVGADQMVTIHGDLSPDQILVASPDSHKIRVVDFDRAGVGPAMRDVGSWAAACRASGAEHMLSAFLEGYAAHADIDHDALNVWEAYAHLSGAPSFFRRRAQNWPARSAAACDLAQEALQR